MMARDHHFYVADALLLGTKGLQAWRKERGCEANCDCAVCHPLHHGLEKLNEALAEMPKDLPDVR